jgi:ParB/RepB/Spo0J family partition protein
MRINPNDIVVNERQRIDIGNLDELCDSIKRLGQLQAVLVERRFNDLRVLEYHLVDGFRRLAAIKKLDLPVIECIEKENLSELQRQEMELEADTKRKDRTWQERCLAYLKLHKLKGFGDRTWSQEKLADVLGKSVGHVNETLSVARTLERTKTQDDDWSKGLWGCETFHNACQYIALRCEDAFYTEILRRKKERDLATGMAKPASCEIQSVNPTEELFTVPTRKVQWNKRVPEQDECKAALAFLPMEDDELKLLHPEGCAIIWLKHLDSWLVERNCLESNENDCLAFPIIWNILQGEQIANSPFQLSYRLGLFTWRSGYKSPFPTPKPAVFTEYMPPEQDWIPPKAVLQMLDYISQEGDKIWLPFGGPIVDVYRAGRIPIWQGEDDEKIKADFIKQFGKVDFI